MKTFFAINSVFLTLAGLCLLALLIPITAHAQQDIQDIDITVAVTNELQRDPAISSHLIDIQTNDGVVTLSGSVDNILSRDMAVRITESIKGVRSVINQIKIKPVIRTDEQLVKDVQQALVANPVTESYEVGVRSLDGIVTLTGTVDSWTEKQMVARVTKGIKCYCSMISSLYSVSQCS